MSRTMIDFERLARPGIRALRAYDPGYDLAALRRLFVEAQLVELGSNENPLGASARVREAIRAALDGIHLYPDPLGGALKQALSALHGVDRERLLLGNGSHELLMQFAQVFAGEGDEVMASQFGFAVYALAAQAAGAQLVSVPANPRTHGMPCGHDLDAFAGALSARTKLVYLANPNNPTGTWFDTDAFARFMAEVPEHVLVVVDEAYAEFVDAPDFASLLDQGFPSEGPPVASLLDRHPNLIVTRTFSKAYALAGLRIGYAVAHPQLVAVMERVRESFNVNALGLVAAQAALSDTSHLRDSIAVNRHQRGALASALRKRGLFVFPSQTNFLLVEFGANAAGIERALVERGVVLRPMDGYGLGECLRITVGTADQNTRLLQALDQVLA